MAKIKRFNAFGSVWNPRTITAPIAAVVMAVLLYTYSVTSIRAAKRNAKLHREADGGQLDMRRESLRRHGVLEQVEGTSSVALFRDARSQAKEDAKRENAYMGDKKARKIGEGPSEEVAVDRARTAVEGELEAYKGRGDAVRRFVEEKPKLPERE